jgi:hypothetical protein
MNDALLRKDLTIPAPGANSTTAAIDPNQQIDEFPDKFELAVILDPIDATALPDDETVTVEFQESDDDSTYTTVSTVTITGADSKGADILEAKFKPSNQKKRGAKVLTNRSYKAKLTTSASAGAGIASIAGAFQINF